MAVTETAPPGVAEMERRFLVGDQRYFAGLVADAPVEMVWDIRQGYITDTDSDPHRIFRIREATNLGTGETAYSIQPKKAHIAGTHGFVRIEQPAAIPTVLFKLAWPTLNDTIEKRRTVLPVKVKGAKGEKGYDVDVEVDGITMLRGEPVEGILRVCGLIEVEFPTLNRAEKFVPPYGFGKEVTRTVSSRRLAMGQVTLQTINENSGLVFQRRSRACRVRSMH